MYYGFFYQQHLLKQCLANFSTSVLLLPKEMKPGIFPFYLLTSFFLEPEMLLMALVLFFKFCQFCDLLHSVFVVF